MAWYEFFFVVARVTAFSAFVDKALNARLTVLGMMCDVGLINAVERFTSLTPAYIAGCADLRAVVDIVAKQAQIC